MLHIVFWIRNAHLYWMFVNPNNTYLILSSELFYVMTNTIFSYSAIDICCLPSSHVTPANTVPQLTMDTQTIARRGIAIFVRRYLPCYGTLYLRNGIKYTCCWFLTHYFIKLTNCLILLLLLSKATLTELYIQNLNNPNLDQNIFR